MSRRDEDVRRRVAHYRELHQSGIYPDPKTMGYRDEEDRRRDIEALAIALELERKAGQETGDQQEGQDVE